VRKCSLCFFSFCTPWGVSTADAGDDVTTAYLLVLLHCVCRIGDSNGTGMGFCPHSYFVIYSAPRCFLEIGLLVCFLFLLGLSWSKLDLGNFHGAEIPGC
jgi:hypothetical protein